MDIRYPLKLRVKQVSYIAEDVLGLTLVEPSGAALPAWTPGAHIDIVLPPGVTRSYSLCGVPGREEYRIAVLHEPNGRGASRDIHERQLVGKVLATSLPRNEFELVNAPHYIFIAGGIGITPLLPMIAETSGKTTWELYYLGRTRGRMGFLDDLAAYAESSGGSLNVVARDERERAAIGNILAKSRADSAVYCCGPESLIREVEEVCRPLASRLSLHIERFGRPSLPASPNDVSPPSGLDNQDDADTSNPCDPDGPFQVELRQSGVVLDVAADESILDCARKVRSGLSFSCSDGYCGTCETSVIAGKPDHRDTVLTDGEKADSRSMMICVGRSRTRRLVLDL